MADGSTDASRATTDPGAPLADRATCLRRWGSRCTRRISSVSQGKRRTDLVTSRCPFTDVPPHGRLTWIEPDGRHKTHQRPAGPGRRDSLRRSWIRGAGASDGTFGPGRGQHPLATLDVGTPRLSAEWGRLAPGRYTMKLIGRPAGPMRHKDFLQDVPSYSYNLPCGHHVSYRIPVALDGFGYCYDCQDYFRHDGVEVTEIPPRIKRRRLSDDEVFE